MSEPTRWRRRLLVTSKSAGTLAFNGGTPGNNGLSVLDGDKQVGDTRCTATEKSRRLLSMLPMEFEVSPCAVSEE